MYQYVLQNIFSKQGFHEENNVAILVELLSNGSLKDVHKKIQEGGEMKDYANTSRQIFLIGVT